MRRTVSTLVAIGLAGAAWAQGVTAVRGLGFEEEFALSADRQALLAQLIPGSEDFYYYACLERQHAGDLAAVPALLKAWIDRHGHGARVEEIECRQALLGFDKDPQGSWRWLRDELGLQFQHQREVPGEKPNLPTQLDERQVSDAEWARRALERHPGSVDGFRGAALERLTEGQLDDQLLASLLSRLERPDLPNLPALIVRHLKLRTSGKFGSLEIHRRLTLAQLEECARLEPNLLADEKFVVSWLGRLAPGADEDYERDRAARLAHLVRLEAFVTRLAPAFNSLKAHVLYHRIEHDLAAGQPDLERFRSYLRLPRSSPSVHPRLVERVERREVAELQQDFATGLPAIGSDEALVRACLEHFLLDASDSAAFAELVEPRYLARVYAETKILAGAGDMERWYSLLDDPGYYEALKQRVELRFPRTQSEWFAADAPVELELDVKNVSTLLVKVYEVHALNFYTSQAREIDASLQLDGLVANEELNFQYEESPLRRVRRKFSFPKLARPGVYVVEFIGNGTASRAVVRKGALHLQERVGSAGHVLRVLDESGALQPAAAVHFEGRRFAADERGEILLPFTTSPGSKSVVLESGPRVALARLQHRAEEYGLTVDAFVGRESLRSGATARLVLRPQLAVSGVPSSLAILEDAVLTIASTDAEGTDSSLEVRAPKLVANEEFAHEIAVPERLVRLSVTLRGRVKSLSTGQPVELSASSRHFLLNGIEATPQTDCPLLGRSAEGWFLDVLGKSGEARADRAVSLALHHRDYTDALEVTLKTDAAGRIRLGRLDGVLTLYASGFPGGAAGWSLEAERHTQPTELHGVVGQVLRVPYSGRAKELTREVASLLELRGDVPLRDAFGHIQLAGGYLELRDLPAGDFELVLLERRRTINVRVTSGAVRDGWAYGRARALELAPATPLHITGVRADQREVVVQLGGARPDTRVHVFATRYVPVYDPYELLRGVPQPGAALIELGALQSDLRAGREIGDEFRYILERRFARKYPGNLLQRPGLLLNPWALDESDTSLGTGGGEGGAFGGRAGGRKSLKARGGGGPSGGRGGPEPGTVPNLDFLGGERPLLANLRPGADGAVRVPLASLGDGQQLHVLALDARECAYATLALPEVQLQPRDQRLTAALDASRHLTEHRGIEFVKLGARFEIDEGATAALQTYDTLEDVYQYFRTRSGSPDLERFAFLVRWPALSSAEKRQLYSEHACHELHYFLFRKDPAFFAEVVKPYLANKLDRTFFDRWLLEEDLERFLDPWAFAQLNVVERILLTQRLGARAASGARHVRELFELLPPDIASEEQRFSTALLGLALSTEPGQGFFKRPGEPVADAAPATPGAPKAGAPAPERARAEEKRKDMEVAKGDVPALEAEDELAEGAEDHNELSDDKAFNDALRRNQAQWLYQPVGVTQTFAESNYWHRRIGEQHAGLIGVNAFWRDFAQAPAGQQFVSVNFTAATGSMAEMLLALGALDLPFVAGEHRIESAPGKRSLTAASPLLVVRKELKDSPPAAQAAPLLVSQDYFRLDDRFEYVGAEQRDKFVRDEFLAQVAYGCRVVVTNPTSAPRELELLLQIPAGAVPVQNGRRTRGQRLQLAPYGTQSYEYAFYFPRPGRFAHYPVHVAQGGELVAFAEASTLNVVLEPSALDTGSWDYVSQRGSEADVLALIAKSNLQRLDLSRIAWRMRERKFFDAVLAVLRERLRFDGTLWSYGVFHADVAAAREFLAFDADFLARCGPWLESALVRIDPVERRAYEHLEFDPLVNPRAHPFGRKREILNADVAWQYQRLLAILAHRPKLDDQDWMSVTYYLLLQDRVEEALAAFAKVDPARLGAPLQHDYFRAYLDFFSDDHQLARGIAERHREHPVARWRALFGQVLSQLDQAAGAAPVVGDERDREQRQDALAAREPALALEIEGRKVTLAYTNVEGCEVSYYPMDIEFLFSSNPFVQQESGAFAYIKPRRSDTIALAKEAAEFSFELPAEFHTANVLVEVRAGGLVRRKPCLQGSLRVQWLESSGQLSVAQSTGGRPLAKVYVKVYAKRPDGSVRFHKDGYTDLRGRFDYASLSGSGADDAVRYSVLIASESDGAVIGEVAPPAR